MFGFLKPRAGLGCRTRTGLQEHLCAACHGMAGFGGRISALLANYDATFWLVVASALCGAQAQPVARRCTALPFRGVDVAAAPPRVAAVMAAMNVLLIAAKVSDDVADGEGLGRRAAALALRPWARRARRFLVREGFPVEAVDGLPAQQAAVERRFGRAGARFGSGLGPGLPGAAGRGASAGRDPSEPTGVSSGRDSSGEGALEALEAPTATTLAACFGHIARLCGGFEPELRRLGASLGRLLYLWDAVSDREEDRRRGRFNALDACGVASADDRLQLHLLEVQKALASLPLGERRALAEGVIAGLRREILGLPPVRAADDCCPCGDCKCDCDCCSDSDTCDACCCCCDSIDCCDDCWPENPCRRRRRRRH